MITVMILVAALTGMQVVWSLLFFQHRDDATNRALRLFLLGACGWGLLELIFFLPLSLELKLFLKRGQILFWGTLNWLFVRFVYRWLRRGPDTVYMLLGAISLLPMIIGWSGEAVVASVYDGPYGLVDVRGPYHAVATLPPLITGLIGLSVVAVAIGRGGTGASVGSLTLILLGGICSLAVGFMANLIVPTFMGHSEFPRLGSIAALPLALFIYWAVRKHEFLVMGPEYLVDSIFTNVRQGLILAGPAGRVRRMNRSAQRMFGLTDAPIVSQRLIDLPGGFALQDCPSRGVEFEIRRDGDVTHLRAMSSSDGLRGGRLLILHDVTDEKRRQELGQFATERIKREADRRKRELAGIRNMEHVGTTAGVITHDFNNFMAVIMGFARAARDDLGGQQSVRKDFDGIIATVHRARDLVQKVLAFSRKGSSKELIFNVADEVNEAIKLLQLSSPKAIAVNFTGGDEPIISRGDPMRIRQALLNVLANASRAMAEWGGRIEARVEAAEVDAPFALMHPPLEPGRYAVATIEDTGEGMSAETLSRAFEPYFSGRIGSQSAGLGLSTALKIVQAGGGTIVGESEKGKGSQFRIYLPCHAGTNRTALPRRDAPFGVVLLGSGESIYGEIAQEFMAREYSVVTLGTRQELYDHLVGANGTVGVVIAPFEIKDDLGAWAAADLVRRAGDIPVVLLVSRASVAKQALARELGVGACVPTFLESDRIVDRIEALFS